MRAGKFLSCNFCGGNYGVLVPSDFSHPFGMPVLHLRFPSSDEEDHSGRGCPRSRKLVQRERASFLIFVLNNWGNVFDDDKALGRSKQDVHRKLGQEILSLCVRARFRLVFSSPPDHLQNSSNWYVCCFVTNRFFRKASLERGKGTRQLHFGLSR